MTIIKNILLYGAAVMVVIILGLYFYLFHFGGLEKIINDRLSSTLEKRYNVDVTIGKVEGSLWSGVELEKISVFYADSLDYYRLAQVARLSTAYSLSNLWNKKYLLDFLTLDSIDIEVRRDSAGAWLLPDFFNGERADSAIAPVFAVEDLTITNANISLISGGDTTGFHDVNLEVGIQGDENTYSLELKRLEFESSDQRYQLDAADGKLTYYDRILVFQDVSLVAADTRMKLSGNILLGKPITGQVDFAADNIDLTEATRLIRPHLKGLLDLNGSVSFVGGDIEGSIDVGGDFYFVEFQNLFIDFRYGDRFLHLDTVYGSLLRGCSIDGRGEIDFTSPTQKYNLSADVNNFNLNNLIKGTFESNLSGRLELEGSSFKKNEMVLRVHTDLYESSFDEYPLQEASGNLVITTDSIFFGDSFRVAYYENEFLVDGRINYHDDMNLNIIADLKNLDRYRGKLFIDQPGGRGYAVATMTGKTRDPDLKGVFVSDSVWIYGLYCDSLYSTVDIRRFFTGKKGSVEVDYYSGAAWSLPYDTGYLSLTIDSNLVYIDTAFLNNRYFYATTRGVFDYGGYPYHIIFDTLSLGLFNQVFVNRQSIIFDADTLGLDFKRAAIGSSEALLSATGRTNFDETLDLSISINQVGIAPWVKLFDEELSITGILSCKASLGGSLLEPVITLKGAVDSLTYRNLLLGDLSTSIFYDKQLLDIDSLVVLSHPGEYYARGYVPIDLAFTNDEIDRLPKKPVDIRVVITDNRFDLVSLMLPSVEQLDGDFHSNFRLSGTADDPHLEGQAYLKNGRLKYFDLAHPIYVDSAGILMEDNSIIIDGIEAYTTQRGTSDGKRRYMYLDGELVVLSLDELYYDLDISLPKEFPFSYELDDITGKVEGDLHVEGTTPPLVTGDLTLLSTRYMVRFAEPDEGSPIMQALTSENSWDLNINIDILSNYWIKNEDVDAEFSGEMNIIREDGKYRFIGIMEILRGRGYLFDKTFRLDPGGLVTFEGGERFNPRLDLIGYTKVQGVSQSAFDDNGTTEQLELGVHISGTLDTVEINPVEGSAFSREDIIPLIVANYYSSDTTSASGQLEGRLSGLISTQMSQIGTRQLNELGVGVETFEIEPLYGNERDPLKARITVGFYTTHNLYVYGRSRLSGMSGQEVGFEYRLNKAFLVEGRRDEDELYHLGLKLHWEY